MSAVKKTDYLPDAATLDLWRVAENGYVNELAPVLARVRDINARNEHGVTALMRAAQYGHVKMVRALLEHGADANIKRNDKFTALALAAFFGHTEIVRALMEHGADSQASTRYDTSPHMWATARTFNEVVDQLEKPAPPRKMQEPVAKPVPAPIRAVPTAAPVTAVPTPAPVSSGPVIRAVARTAVVRTLKDPPEIWDLVHEVPRGFNARSAFLTRLRAFKTGLAFRVAAVALLITAGTVGVMVLRGVQARNDGTLATHAKAPSTTTINAEKANSSQENTSRSEVQQPSAAPAVAAPSFLAPEANNVSVSETPGVNRKTGSHSSRRVSHRVEQNPTPPVAASATVQPVATPTVKTNLPEAQPKPKAASPLSTQMISPAKNAAPKGKVIQWP
ncbi:MAG TPA: ankyrin repeat domain-containing protein [Pyrinomonadaceae bacterium]|nr:ankyrin repeat domain-containing protein [Pyrinomonadaceae bacterium]